MTNEVLAKRIADLERQLSDERMKNMRLKVEAGRAGFVAGYDKCWRESYGTKPNTDSVDEYADSYANRVGDGQC